MRNVATGEFEANLSARANLTSGNQKSHEITSAYFD